MQRALIIGGNSDIAQETIRLLGKEWNVATVTRNFGDLADLHTRAKLSGLLYTMQPDVIIHCAGVFGGNDLEFTPTFRINTESAWWPIRYYLDHPPLKLVRIILIGSSCYEHGRRNYILYAASKAALHSIWQGSSEAVADTVKIGIIHPVRVNTKMVADHPHHSPHLCLTAEDVAREIINMTTMTEHQHLDMGYKTE